MNSPEIAVKISRGIWPQRIAQVMKRRPEKRKHLPGDWEYAGVTESACTTKRAIRKALATYAVPKHEVLLEL